jgi:hypothetical protein
MSEKTHPFPGTRSALLSLMALAALSALTLLPSCARLHSQVQDALHGWNSCQPVNESCFPDPKDFYALPQIAAIASWRGRPISELLAAWGQPETVIALGAERYRYVWLEKKTLPGEVAYQHDQWTNQWGLVRSPDQDFECKTYMEVEPGGTVTPMWVDRLGVCTQYFSARVPAPVTARPVTPAARPATGAATAPAATPAAEEESPIPLGPPPQIREQEHI